MRNLIFVLFCLFLAGCSFKPQMPEINSTFEYKFESSDISDKWWQEFNDENLNSLVEEALKNNIDLKVAYLNLKKAELLLANSRADLFPNLNLNASAKKAQNGRDSNSFNSFSLSAVLNYEIDLWGRVKNSIQSNNAILNATKYDLNSSRLSIASSVVDSYLLLVSLKMQEEIYKDSLKSYEETMNYRKKQLEVGSIPEAVYLQSIAAVQSAKIGLAKIQNSITSALSTLSILVAKDNNDILYSHISSSDKLPLIPEVGLGISSDILLKRSDVASAYERLKSQNALIGVAKAAYFPTLSLTGVFGFSSSEFDKLFMPYTSSWSFGGSLAQSLFDYARRTNNVKLAELSQDISLLNYEKTIKTALAEVRLALDKRRNLIDIVKFQDELLSSQKEIYKRISDQYNAGYVDHLNLLDAQRNLLNARLSNIDAKLSLAKSIVAIYKAFGGGFNSK